MRLYQKDAYSQKLQHKHYNERKRTETEGVRVKDMEFLGIKQKT